MFVWTAPAGPEVCGSGDALIGSSHVSGLLVRFWVGRSATRPGCQPMVLGLTSTAYDTIRPSCSMPDRTTLARLGKLVATDVTTGQPGANSWAASQALEAHPDAVLDLIEMLFTEGRKTRPNEKLVSAYVYMIGQALEFIRIAAENGQASAQEIPWARLVASCSLAE